MSRPTYEERPPRPASESARSGPPGPGVVGSRRGAPGPGSRPRPRDPHLLPPTDARHWSRTGTDAHPVREDCRRRPSESSVAFLAKRKKSQKIRENLVNSSKALNDLCYSSGHCPFFRTLGPFSESGTPTDVPVVPGRLPGAPPHEWALLDQVQVDADDGPEAHVVVLGTLHPRSPPRRPAAPPPRPPPRMATCPHVVEPARGSTRTSSCPSTSPLPGRPDPLPRRPLSGPVTADRGGVGGAGRTGVGSGPRTSTTTP